MASWWHTGLFIALLANGAFSLWIWIWAVVGLYPDTIVKYEGLHNPYNYVYYTAISAGVFLILLILAFVAQWGNTKNTQRNWNSFKHTAFAGFLLYFSAFWLALGFYHSIQGKFTTVITRPVAAASVAPVTLVSLPDIIAPITLIKANAALATIRTALNLEVNAINSHAAQLNGDYAFLLWMVILSFIFIVSTLVVIKVCFTAYNVLGSDDSSYQKMGVNLEKKISKKQNKSNSTLFE